METSRRISCSFPPWPSSARMRGGPVGVRRECGGYQPSGMVGVTTAAWSRGDAIFPVEAAVVWLSAPFSSILSYEFAKALTHHPRPTRVALFGSVSARDEPAG